MVGDEISWSGGHKVPNKLKSIITQTRRRMEKKGKDAVTVDSFMNVIFLSNNPDPVKVEGDDRRYDVRNVSDKHVGDCTCFKKLGQCLTDEAADYFYTYLMSLDLDDFVIQDVPKTAEKEEMKVYGMKPIELFVEEMPNGDLASQEGYQHTFKDDKGYVEHTETPTVYFNPGQTYQISMDSLFQRFLDFCKDEAGRVDSKMSKRSFSMQIRKLLQIENCSTDRHGGTPITLRVEKV
ncbi:hypothetical protein PhCBS80983_g06452 [Powellomyces hirtus]|uniref:NrS-1 polymerase-like helicase domain-containing protein n=1 Tax=Powellomyces hirtus TaxID=109895 RepID=A0A507DNH5_9FUNG|nr:hypothetical protein PhCBS80983_g06452 [Powellomyces hirtus]